MRFDMTTPQKRGIEYEKRQAKLHGARHVGGPGKPDYVRGKTKGEVKNWATPVTSSVVAKAKADGVSEIVSKNGFTKPAEALAKKSGIKTIHPRKSRR